MPSLIDQLKMVVELQERSTNGPWHMADFVRDENAAFIAAVRNLPLRRIMGCVLDSEQHILTLGDTIVELHERICEQLDYCVELKNRITEMQEFCSRAVIFMDGDHIGYKGWLTFKEKEVIR